jgi:tetratricopeptide (TPR) repeat protein
MTRHDPMIAAVVLGVLCTIRAAVAFGQERDPAASETLFKEGRRLMKSRDFASACPKLEESLRLDPAAGTLINLAECEEQLGRTASAWQHWRAAADSLPAGDKRRGVALNRASALEKALPRLTITLAPGTPSDTRVKRDGTFLGAPSLVPTGELPWCIDRLHEHGVDVARAVHEVAARKKAEARP